MSNAKTPKLNETDRARAIELGLNPDDPELEVFVECGWTVDEMADSKLGSRDRAHENRVTWRGRYRV